MAAGIEDSFLPHLMFVLRAAAFMWLSRGIDSSWAIAYDGPQIVPDSSSWEVERVLGLCLWSSALLYSGIDAHLSLLPHLFVHNLVIYPRQTTSKTGHTVSVVYIDREGTACVKWLAASRSTPSADRFQADARSDGGVIWVGSNYMVNGFLGFWLLNLTHF